MAAAAGAAAGGAAYYLLGPNAKAHQKKAKEVLNKMKKDVGSEMKKIKDVSVPVYNKALKVISENYAEQYKAHEKDIKALAKRLRDEWVSANKAVKKSVSSTKKSSAKPKTKSNSKKA